MLLFVIDVIENLVSIVMRGDVREIFVHLPLFLLVELGSFYGDDE